MRFLSDKNDQAVERHVATAAEALKRYSVAELESFGSGRVIESFSIGRRTYKVEALCEPIAHGIDGKFVVLVESWIKHLLWSNRIMQGFVVTLDNKYVDIAETDLWNYD